MLSDIEVFLPGLIVLWTLFFGIVIIKPQGLFNSFLLMFSLFYTMFSVGIIFSNLFEYLPIIMFIAMMILVLTVPILLIINGITMIKYEHPSFANMLSLLFGAVIAIGEISGALVFILGGYGIDIGKVNVYAFLIFATVVYFSIFILSFVVYVLFIDLLPYRHDFDYIVIHGCGLINGKKMSKLLSCRVDKAIEVYEKCNRKPIIIASGGKGGDEALSEAEAMKNYLLEKGIPEKAIICEDESVNTMENLINSKQIIESRSGGHKTALVTSNFHVYRCIRYASKLKWRCVGIGAKVARYYWVSAVLREFVAVFTRKKPLLLILLGYIFVILLPILAVSIN